MTASVCRGITDAAIRRALRRRVPIALLQPSAVGLLGVIPHIVVICLGYRFLASRPLSATTVIVSALVGHSYACLAFVAHDVAHGSVVRHRGLRYCCELLLWSPLLVPPTLWRVLHNQTHHAHANTPADCDRAFLQSDQPLRAKKIYMRWFSPLQGSFGLRNPLVLTHFVTYIIRNIVTVGLGIGVPIVATVPRIRPGDRRRVMGELIVLVALHAVVLARVWAGMSTLLLLEVVPIIVSSATLMVFIFTNHLAEPILTSPNTLATTVSLTVPRYVAAIYSHFNYHVEHHLFPAAPSSSYPLIAQHLRGLAGASYKVKTIGNAWRDVLESPFVRPDAEPLDVLAREGISSQSIDTERS